jgi:hypothetical protein
MFTVKRQLHRVGHIFPALTPFGHRLAGVAALQRPKAPPVSAPEVFDDFFALGGRKGEVQLRLQLLMGLEGKKSTGFANSVKGRMLATL